VALAALAAAVALTGVAPVPGSGITPPGNPPLPPGCHMSETDPNQWTPVICDPDS
jgi:hypothetical protein